MASSQTMYNRHRRVTQKLSALYADVTCFRETSDELIRRLAQFQEDKDRIRLNQYYKGWADGQSSVFWDKLWGGKDCPVEWVVYCGGKWCRKDDTNVPGFKWSEVKSKFSCHVWKGTEKVFSVPEVWYECQYIPRNRYTHGTYAPSHLTLAEVEEAYNAVQRIPLV